jgi:hypothetical protein
MKMEWQESHLDLTNIFYTKSEHALDCCKISIMSAD